MSLGRKYSSLTVGRVAERCEDRIQVDQRDAIARRERSDGVDVDALEPLPPELLRPGVRDDREGQVTLLAVPDDPLQVGALKRQPPFEPSGRPPLERGPVPTQRPEVRRPARLEVLLQLDEDPLIEPGCRLRIPPPARDLRGQIRSASQDAGRPPSEQTSARDLMRFEALVQELVLRVRDVDEEHYLVHLQPDLVDQVLQAKPAQERAKAHDGGVEDIDLRERGSELTDRGPREPEPHTLGERITEDEEPPSIRLQGDAARLPVPHPE